MEVITEEDAPQKGGVKKWLLVAIAFVIVGSVTTLLVFDSILLASLVVGTLWVAILKVAYRNDPDFQDFAGDAFGTVIIWILGVVLAMLFGSLTFAAKLLVQAL